jgi:hypothetical protein
MRLARSIAQTLNPFEPLRNLAVLPAFVAVGDYPATGRKGRTVPLS